MHRRLQFDMRENPASDRRHGSRLAVSTEVASHFNRKEQQGGLNAIEPADPAVADAHSSTVAVENAAATVEEKQSASCHAFRLPLSRLETTFEPLLGSEEAARLLGNIHVKTLQRYARKAEIPGYRIGGHWYFRESELDAWLRYQINSKSPTR